MPVGAFVPSRIHLDYAEWQAPLIGNVGQVWAYTGSGYAPVALNFDPAGTAAAAVAAHVALSNPHSQYYLASGVSGFGATLIDDANAAAARTTLGLGTAAILSVGTGANQIVQLDGSARLPAVDGSQLTGVVATASPGGSTTQVQYNNAGALAGHSGMTYDSANSRLTVTGGLVAPSMRPASDSTTALQMQNAAGTAVVTVDTTNLRLVVGGDRLKTDRWLNSDTNFILGIGALGAGTLSTSGGGNNGLYNFVLGYQAGYSLSTGNTNFIAGYQAGYSLSTGNNHTLIGRLAGYSLQAGSGNTFIGNSAGQLTGSAVTGNTIIGGSAGRSLTSDNNTLIGNNAGVSTTGGSDVVIGANALASATSSINNVIIGHEAGYLMSSPGTNVIIGRRAMYSGGSATNSVVVGISAGQSATGSNLVLLGSNAGFSETTNNKLHIANLSTKSLLLGDFNANTLAIGFTDLSVGTAAVDCAPSTTARASLRFRAGTAPTSPNAGDVWYATGGRLNVYRAATEIFATGVQATGGAATAGASYTSTEQTMLQRVYDAARAFGLLS